MEYNIIASNVSLIYDPKPFSLKVKISDCPCDWTFASDPTIELKDGRVIHLNCAECESDIYDTGVSKGVRAVYTSIKYENGEPCPFTVETTVKIDVSTSDLVIEAMITGDDGEISGFLYPTRIVFDAEEGHGYTVLPRMQGTLIPAGHPSGIAVDSMVYDRGAYMPIFAQIKDGNGYLAIFETPYDAKFRVVGEDIQPLFISSLGKLRYKRAMRYRFFKGDYVTAAKLYREYASEHGRGVSLREKIIKNPNIKKLVGTPIIHTLAAMRIHPMARDYNKENPERNNICTPFSVIEARLRELKARGLDKAYLHLDGWGVHGYDNCHPDPFPINEGAGGTEGLKSLQNACSELDYYFGIHDQYHDYYYDADTFDFKNATVNEDGSHFYCHVWAGGPHTYLCAMLAPDYVRRNFNEFNRLGIKLDGAYLDVFSIIELDECFSKDHPMTREQCAYARRSCFDILTTRGIIPSSEETVECMLDSIALCHYAPFFTSPSEKHIGIPIPLFNLVYHDCVVIPWPWNTIKGKGSYFGIPEADRGFYWALLNGGTVYCGINETAENIEYLKIALELHEKVALFEMESHEFVDGDPRHRKSVFSDGTEVECDFDNETFVIRYPDGKTVTGK